MAFPDISTQMPPVRGKLSFNTPLAPYTWLRVGGAAQVLFLPKDVADLSRFLGALPGDVPVQVLGAASNVIVRDGGLPGVTVRLGPAFGKVVAISETRIRAGAAALDQTVAKTAAKAGISGLEFYAGIPGTIGGALRMNAGCYGGETKDILIEARAMDRQGRICVMPLSEFGYAYRHSHAADDLIFIDALFEGKPDAPEDIQARMDAITARREDSQPIREKTGGSTFKNPDQIQSGGRGAWKVIDDAGGRGFTVGGARMSEKHCNFMVNKDGATAADLEALGETIRDKVKTTQGVDLHWEIKRIGLRAG